MTSNVISKVPIKRALPRLYHLSRYVHTTSKRSMYDLVIVGGGIVGCATAREMKIRHPKLTMALVEKEKALAMHQTGHNSGVIHAGIYYVPGSMKAKLCVEGLKLTYEYLYKNNIPHKKIGKLIVAKDTKQIKNIDDLFEQGNKNNVPDLQIVEKNYISRYEPKCQGEKALWSPWTGIVDWAVVCQSFANDFQQMGGEIFLNFEVTGFTEIAESNKKNELLGVSVQSKTKSILTKYVLTCGGLYSDRLAVMSGGKLNPQIIPFRGQYFILHESKKHLCTTNIYPVSDTTLPFLGVHFTPRLNGDIWLGPNAVMAFSREGYRWNNINMKDCMEIVKYPGTYKLFWQYLFPGSREMIKSIFYPLIIKDLQKFIPEISFRDIRRGPTGVRAQALDSDGKLVDDFIFDQGVGKVGSRIIHCRNAPSPAATSSMAIAKFIADKLEKDFKF